MKRLLAVLCCLAIPLLLAVGGCGGGGGGRESAPDVPSPELLSAIGAAAAEVSQAFDVGYDEGGPAGALQAAQAAALGSPAVETASATDDALWVRYRDAGTDVWLISTTPAGNLGTLSAETVCPPQIADAAGATGNSSAVIVNVLAPDVDPVFAESTGALRALASEMSRSGNFSVRTVEGRAATVAEFRRLSDYGIVVMFTHGAATQGTPGAPLGPASLLTTGEEAPTGTFVSGYWNEWVNGRMMRVQVGVGDRDACGNTTTSVRYWAVTERFFATHYHSTHFPSTLFYSGACQGLMNTEMARELTKVGVAAYVGWSETVCVSAYTGRALLSAMLGGGTLAEAMSSLPDDLRVNERYSPSEECPNARWVRAELQYYPSSAGTIRLASTTLPQAIATSDEGYDDVAAVLGYMGRQATLVPLEQIDDAADLAAYQAYAVNCAEGARNVSGATAQALASFVAAGGRLYASDWAYAVVQRAFPGRIGVYPDPYCGEATTTTAQVRDSALRALLGGRTSVEVVYDLGAWVPIRSAAAGVTALLEGDYEIGDGSYSSSIDAATTPGGRQSRRAPRSLASVMNVVPAGTRATGPLAVSFSHGAGKVVYTTFHCHAQVNVVNLAILDYFLGNTASSSAVASASAPVHSEARVGRALEVGTDPSLRRYLESGPK